MFHLSGKCNIAPVFRRVAFYQKTAVVWNRSDHLLLPLRLLSADAQQWFVKLTFKHIKNLKHAQSWTSAFTSAWYDVKNKPCLKLVDCTSNFWFRLSQMRLFVGDCPIRRCNLYAKAKAYQGFFFFFHIPSADKWTTLSFVSSYLSGEGLPTPMYVKVEHILPLHDLCVSVIHLSDVWLHIHGMEQKRTNIDVAAVF